MSGDCKHSSVEIYKQDDTVYFECKQCGKLKEGIVKSKRNDSCTVSFKGGFNEGQERIQNVNSG